MALYRTAQGKALDMNQFARRNERVRAVGNMNVNARGDILDSNNRVINDNTKRVKDSYTKAVSEKQNKSPKPHLPAAPKKVDVVEQLSKEEKDFFDDDEDIVK